MMKWIPAATAVCALAPMAVAGVPDCSHDLPPTPKAHLLATSLLAAYRSNPVRFDLEHKGDQVRARGRVHKIDPDGAAWFQIGANRFMVGDRLVCVFLMDEGWPDFRTTYPELQYPNRRRGRFLLARASKRSKT